MTLSTKLDTVSRKRWHCSIPFSAIACRADKLSYISLRLLFPCVVCIHDLQTHGKNNLSKWIPGYLRWFERTAPSNVTAGIAFPAALLNCQECTAQCLGFAWIDERSRVLAPVEYFCYFSTCYWTALDASWVSFVVFDPIICQCEYNSNTNTNSNTRLNPSSSWFRSPSPCTYTL